MCIEKTLSKSHLHTFLGVMASAFFWSSSLIMGGYLVTCPRKTCGSLKHHILERKSNEGNCGSVANCHG